MKIKTWMLWVLLVLGLVAISVLVFLGTMAITAKAAAPPSQFLVSGIEIEKGGDVFWKAWGFPKLTVQVDHYINGHWQRPVSFELRGTDYRVQLPEETSRVRLQADKISCEISWFSDRLSPGERLELDVVKQGFDPERWLVHLVEGPTGTVVADVTGRVSDHSLEFPGTSGQATVFRRDNGEVVAYAQWDEVSQHRVFIAEIRK